MTALEDHKASARGELLLVSAILAPAHTVAITLLSKCTFGSVAPLMAVALFGSTTIAATQQPCDEIKESHDCLADSKKFSLANKKIASKCRLAVSGGILETNCSPS
ncbi:hypothetical protein NOVOSPHI9U_100006 [Novosphingobium sp. 9U]|nr:hypothetical protein NOVOSPHI9U_100006 [Novosphingobium sp. 9U]